MEGKEFSETMHRTHRMKQFEQDKHSKILSEAVKRRIDKHSISYRSVSGNRLHAFTGQTAFWHTGRFR